MNLPRLRGASLVLPLALSALLAVSACFIVRTVTVSEVDGRADSVQVRSPVKAHLLDGTTVVYRNGVLIRRGRLTGQGTRYDLTLGNPAAVTDLPLDSVVGLESFRSSVDAGATVGVSLLATAAAVGATVAIACAIDPKCFGSCPTYYSDSAGTPVLEAEGFSYSIAPLFESRDVDRLRARPDSTGVLRLEVRNEAFETHYINHLELLEVSHATDELVAPDPWNHPLAIGRPGPPVGARDRGGRSVADLLADAEGRTYATDSSVLAGVTEQDLEDWVELTFDAPATADSIALLLRLRNSLLNTVLLYDLMLGDPGARSLDWQAEQLAKVGPALELGTWYAARMGLAVEVWREGVWSTVARLKDTGPVAWKDVAVPLPRVPGTEMRIRLRFPADNWRIDRAGLAPHIRRPEIRSVPLAGVSGLGGAPETRALASLVASDARYLETSAGQAFLARWDVGGGTAGVERTFLLASQGYYIEWVRRGWIAASRDTTTFRPNDSTLLRAIVRWREVQDTLEPRFFATRVPVR
jgi:hypothetical protein